MTALDSKFRGLANRLIAKNGKSITYTSVAGGAYNVADGSVTNTDTTSTAKVVIEDYGSYKYQSGYESGQILVGDKKFTIAAQSISNPKKGDKITLDGVVYSIVNVKETWSGEQIAVYELQGRT